MGSMTRDREGVQNRSTLIRQDGKRREISPYTQYCADLGLSLSIQGGCHPIQALLRSAALYKLQERRIYR